SEPLAFAAPTRSGLLSAPRPRTIRPTGETPPPASPPHRPGARPPRPVGEVESPGPRCREPVGAEPRSLQFRSSRTPPCEVSLVVADSATIWVPIVHLRHEYVAVRPTG